MLGAGEGAGPGRAWRRLRSSAGAVAGWLRGLGGETLRGADSRDFQPVVGPERVSGGEGRTVSAVPLPARGVRATGPAAEPPASADREACLAAAAPAQAWESGRAGAERGGGARAKLGSSRGTASVSASRRATARALPRPGGVAPAAAAAGDCAAGRPELAPLRERGGRAAALLRAAPAAAPPRGLLPGRRCELRPTGCKETLPYVAQRCLRAVVAVSVLVF